MGEIDIKELVKTTKELIENLIIRIDNILKEFDDFQIQDIFSDERIAFILDDFVVLTTAINIIEKENPEIYLDELLEKINLLYNSMESRDKLLFKDILEFEIKPLLSYWVDII